jgi:predicted aldo/keto reductase-like oxidoreductase
MERVAFGRTGLTVSRIAFGGIPIMRVAHSDAVRIIRTIIGLGINFLDTARRYDDSEDKIGDAISEFRREELILSSKSPAREKKTFLEELDTSLRKLNVEYIDIYHLHNVSRKQEMDQVLDSGGAMEGLQQAIREGKVRIPAFSSHSLDIAEKMMNTDLFDVAQVPFNFVDDQAAEKIIPLAEKMNIGFISMKPLGGGMLEDAGLCFRYLKHYPSIIPDPGVESVEEMQEIIQIMENPGPLTEQDRVQIENIKEELGDKWCHRCEYCQPCPQGINIAMVLNLRSALKRLPYHRVANPLRKTVEQAKECIECRECVERCPYGLDIPELIKENIRLYEDYTGERSKR